MRKTAVLSVIALLGFALMTGGALAQSGATKTVLGKVFGSDGGALSGAIVYLENDKTNDIRSFISIDDGSYRFGQLAPDTDYKVWARYKDEKSSTKEISSYDSRAQVVINLHIKTK